MTWSYYLLLYTAQDNEAETCSLSFRYIAFWWNCYWNATSRGAQDGFNRNTTKKSGGKTLKCLSPSRLYFPTEQSYKDQWIFEDKALFCFELNTIYYILPVECICWNQFSPKLKGKVQWNCAGGGGKCAFSWAFLSPQPQISVPSSKHWNPCPQSSWGTSYFILFFQFKHC